MSYPPERKQNTSSSSWSYRYSPYSLTAETSEETTAFTSLYAGEAQGSAAQ